MPGWNPAESLAGQVALVTGASRGIGRCIAIDLARAGAAVAVHYLESKDGAAAVAAEIRAAGGRAEIVQGDVGIPSDIRRLHSATVKALGPVDILVNNASIASTVKHGFDVYMNTTEEEFDRMMRVNVGGAFFCCQAVLPSMIERRHGIIVNISSGSGIHQVARQECVPAWSAGQLCRTRSHRYPHVAHQPSAEGLRWRPARPRRLSPGNLRHGRVPLLAAGLLHHGSNRVRERGELPALISALRQRLAQGVRCQVARAIYGLAQED
jgi:NAD(P)-dependent dehydrogenase (short-subunit alcohol dehydrogenase family)